jgi:hypothetical protein
MGNSKSYQAIVAVGCYESGLVAEVIYGLAGQIYHKVCKNSQCSLCTPWPDSRDGKYVIFSAMKGK